MPTWQRLPTAFHQKEIYRAVLPCVAIASDLIVQSSLQKHNRITGLSGDISEKNSNLLRYKRDGFL